jgi:hypothetical protein
VRRPHWSEAAYSDLDHFTGVVGADATYPLTSKTKEAAGRCVYCLESVFVDRNVSAMSELARFDGVGAARTVVHPACVRLDPFMYLDQRQRMVIERHYGLVTGVPEPLSEIALKRSFSTRGGARETHSTRTRSTNRRSICLQGLPYLLSTRTRRRCRSSRHVG